MEAPTNLEIRCAELGRKLSERVKDEKVFNEALSILEEQGPYAMFLYLKARHKEEAGPISEKSLDFLSSIFGLSKKGDILEAIKELATDLDRLLFARDLLRTALSYARYHLKAGKD
ncbi:hypothetical protein [Thermus sp.]|jgi:hypothetical protein|uniref:hypothetical protein n=1 Tax=Thermus sp. TaxID=275 RepID=UPI00321F6D9F